MDRTKEAQRVLRDLKFEDITCELSEVTQAMANTLLPAKEFTLMESMMGIQVMDPKMDIKMNMDQLDTLPKMLASGRIKHPKDLSLTEVNPLHPASQELTSEPHHPTH